MAKQTFREFAEEVRRHADRPLQPMNRRELAFVERALKMLTKAGTMANDAEKIIPLAVLRAITREPVLPRDPVERVAQADRIRKLMEGQPLHVRQLARRLLRAHWDKVSQARTTGSRNP